MSLFHFDYLHMKFSFYKSDLKRAEKDVIVSTAVLPWRSVITEVLLKASAVSSEAEAHGGDVVITVARAPLAHGQ